MISLQTLSNTPRPFTDPNQLTRTAALCESILSSAPSSSSLSFIRNALIPTALQDSNFSLFIPALISGATHDPSRLTWISTFNLDLHLSTSPLFPTLLSTLAHPPPPSSEQLPTHLFDQLVTHCPFPSPTFAPIEWPALWSHLKHHLKRPNVINAAVSLCLALDGDRVPLAHVLSNMQAFDELSRLWSESTELIVASALIAFEQNHSLTPELIDRVWSVHEQAIIEWIESPQIVTTSWPVSFHWRVLGVLSLSRNTLALVEHAAKGERTLSSDAQVKRAAVEALTKLGQSATIQTQAMELLRPDASLIRALTHCLAGCTFSESLVNKLASLIEPPCEMFPDRVLDTQAPHSWPDFVDAVVTMMHKQQPTLRFTSVCAGYMDKHVPWSTPRLSDRILQLLPPHMSVDAVLALHPHLVDWESKPWAKHALIWCSERVPFPHVASVFVVLLPATLRLLDDYDIARKTLGVRGAMAILSGSTMADARGVGDVLLETLMKHFSVGRRDGDFLQAMLPVILLAHERLLPNPDCDAAMSIVDDVIREMDDAERLESRRLFVRSIAPLIERVGLLLVDRLPTLVPLLMRYLHAPDDVARLEALDVVQVTMTACWPRVPVHRNELFKGIVHCYATAESTLSTQVTASPLSDAIRLKAKEAARLLFKLCGESMQQELMSAVDERLMFDL